jgi:DNA-binding response OmpR family regulator
MKETILIVEDEKDIIKMLEYNLKKEGFKTLSASDGEDALDSAHKDHPDLIILDLMLPESLNLVVNCYIQPDNTYL